MAGVCASVYPVKLSKEKCSFRIILDSSMVERTAVNRDVVGSSPTRGVRCLQAFIFMAPWSSG